jgi:hypothetical protein
MSYQTRESLLESLADGKTRSTATMNQRVLFSLLNDGFVADAEHARGLYECRITPAGLDYIQNWHGPRYIHPDWFRRHELANAPGCFHPSGRLARVV